MTPDETVLALSDQPVFTMTNLVGRACAKYRDKPLITFESETWSYGRAWDRGGQLADALHGRGLERGDRIGLMMANHLDYTTAEIAGLRGGYVKVAMNEMLNLGGFRHILRDSQARAVIVGEAFFDTIQELRPDLPQLEWVVGLTEDPPEGIIPLDTLLEEGSAEGPDVNVDPQDPVLFQYTGGTTGKPKGAVHTQLNLAMDLYAHVMEFDIRYEERMLLMTPLPHSAGYHFAAGMLRGAHIFVTAGFDPGTFMRMVEREHLSWSFMVPTMIYRVLDHEDLSRRDLSSLETLVYGAAPITRERLVEGLEQLGQVFIQLYGQSEVPNIATCLPKEDHRPDAGSILESAGQPSVMVDVRIADPEDKTNTEPLPPNEPGEILLRAPYNMRGYHQLPEKTDDTLVNGWVRTGDIGRKDEQGYVYMLDRDKDMIVSGGMNVYTKPVEDVLSEHPEVKEVAVFGIPHDDWGEAVHAAVVPRRRDAVTEEALIDFSGRDLARYEKPKGIEFVDELPTTPYGKIDKKALREPYWEGQSRQVS